MFDVNMKAMPIKAMPTEITGIPTIFDGKSV